jgi:hypothetical protein
MDDQALMPPTESHPTEDHNAQWGVSIHLLGLHKDLVLRPPMTPTWRPSWRRAVPTAA